MSYKTSMPGPETALRGRSERVAVTEAHYVNGRPLTPPYPEGAQLALFGLGCFWGAERVFWELPGVWLTAAGYAAGHTRNPTYREVCSGQTGHNEVVRVVFNPRETSYQNLLTTFWEAHDPTQAMRQGNDVGTQYRSGIYWYDEGQRKAAEASRDDYQQVLRQAGYGEIATEIRAAPEFYFAETFHQQYLARNPTGYCGLGGTGVRRAAGGRDASS